MYTVSPITFTLMYMYTQTNNESKESYIVRMVNFKSSLVTRHPNLFNIHKKRGYTRAGKHTTWSLIKLSRTVVAPNP